MESSTQAHTHHITEGETGFVTEAKGYLLKLEGFPSVRIDDIIINENGQRALVTALNEEDIEVLLLDSGKVEAGDRFTIHTEGVRFSFGEHLLGRVINALGDPLDGKEVLPAGKDSLHLRGSAPGMDARATMTQQLHTGMSVVDILLPISKGQRQLVVGPISSGKTVFLESAIAHQRGSDVVCIYAFIGRPLSYINEALSRIYSESGNMQTITIVTLSDEPAPMVYLNPTVAFSLAEHFSKKGRDVFLVLDDLGTHAKYLREIALLSGRIPGRESYPGDMFYQHAHLLERAGYFNKKAGGGSITVLPVLETNIEDISNLVSTNLMAATDGHLFFSSAYHAEGYFPAVLPNNSVTRIGRKAQSNLAKQLSIKSQSLLAEYEKQRDYSRFGTQLSEKTRRTIQRGEVMRVFLKQEPLHSIGEEEQIILLSLVFTTFFEKHDVAFAEKNKKALSEVIKKNRSLEPIVTSAGRGTVSLEQFIKRLETVMPYFDSACQQ